MPWIFKLDSMSHRMRAAKCTWKEEANAEIAAGHLLREAPRQPNGLHEKDFDLRC